MKQRDGVIAFFEDELTEVTDELRMLKARWAGILHLLADDGHFAPAKKRQVRREVKVMSKDSWHGWGLIRIRPAALVFALASNPELLDLAEVVGA